MMVDEFMRLAKQEIPEKPIEPSEEVRLLRAKLIYEEALETINALGVSIINNEFKITGPFDMVEVVDGCCDLKVVTTGTLTAIGVDDIDVQLEVDKNNLDKFGPGHSIREDGKLIKPPNHQPPNIRQILIEQGWNN